MKHHYEYIAPDGETFENMAAVLNYSEGNEDEWKDDGGETASAGGGCDEFAHAWIGLNSRTECACPSETKQSQVMRKVLVVLNELRTR